MYWPALDRQKRCFLHALRFSPSAATQFPTHGKPSAVASMLVTMAPDEDTELMLRYRAGDIRAFELLYLRHKDALYRYLLRHVRHAASAADLFQEVWTRLIATRERYEPRAKFATFLFHIAHNCAIDFHRRGKSSPIGASVDDETAGVPEPIAAIGDQPESRMESDQRAASFQHGLARLPAEQREAFLLYEEAGLSIEEIGAATGVGAETAKSRLRYAVSKLKKALRGAGDARALNSLREKVNVS
jgi:RNA polymerase sigma-70 factor (ECF subfamily)